MPLYYKNLLSVFLHYDVLNNIILVILYYISPILYITNFLLYVVPMIYREWRAINKMMGIAILQYCMFVWFCYCSNFFVIEASLLLS